MARYGSPTRFVNTHVTGVETGIARDEEHALIALAGDRRRQATEAMQARSAAQADEVRRRIKLPHVSIQDRRDLDP